MKKTSRARYTLEFKQEAVRLVESGQSIVAMARTLGVVHGIAKYGPPRRDAQVAQKSTFSRGIDDDQRVVLGDWRPTTSNMHPFTLHPINAQVFEVRSSTGAPVGNLKRVGAVWKFKAIGYGESGDVWPGGGPLTDWHNTVLSAPTESLLNAALLGGCPPQPATR